MRFHALAMDYDGTIAHHGRVPPSTVAALDRLRASGRKLLLVTGRQLDELMGIFPEVDHFERIVAENGALIYHPSTRKVRTLADRPEAAFVEELRRREVPFVAVGHVIVAAWKPHETIILETIRDMGLDLQVIFNKEAVMVLPAGVNKATGLAAALSELELSPHEVVGVGDAENDQAFLAMCECGVAVDNALQTVKDRADLVMPGDHGLGVEQLCEHILQTDLQELMGTVRRHHLLLGKSKAGGDVLLPPHGANLLIAGPSASGKSTIAKCILERLQERHYQYCILDPEGDYDGFEGAVTLGSGKGAPSVEEILHLLARPETNVIVNLVGVPLRARPGFVLGLLPRLHEMRARNGRPHWIVIDETHHLLPAGFAPALSALPQKLDRLLLITVHPDQIMRPVLDAVTKCIVVGARPEETLAKYCQAVEQGPPFAHELPAEYRDLRTDEVLLWHRDQHDAIERVQVVLSRKEQQRREHTEEEPPPEPILGTAVEAMR